MNKILIFGNSGSGKSTLAVIIAKQRHLPHLDLDVLAWASTGVRKPLPASLKEIHSFITANDNWVIEGCYGFLIHEVTAFCTQLLFLNPGIEACLENNLTRPWEPHKYASAEAQNNNLKMLQAWVKEYEIRDDEYSLKFHREIFNQFDGCKREYTNLRAYDDTIK